MPEKKMNERTLKILRKYFDFFDIEGYLPPKWIKHIIKHLNAFFTGRDEIEEIIEEKEELLNTLTINDIIEILDDLTGDLTNAGNQLVEQGQIFDTRVKKLEDAAGDLSYTLDVILTDQENFDWFIWDDAQQRITAPVCFFSSAETLGYNDGVLRVETEETETTYKNGVLTLPATLKGN